MLQVVTAYHYLLLGQGKLALVNAVSGRVVQEVTVAGPYAVDQGAGAPLALLRDDSSGQVLLVCTDGVLEASLRREDRDMWKVRGGGGGLGLCLHVLAVLYCTRTAVLCWCVGATSEPLGLPAMPAHARGWAALRRRCANQPQDQQVALHVCGPHSLPAPDHAPPAHPSVTHHLPYLPPQVFLEHGEYDSALKLCTSAAQRDTVHLARAEPAFEERDYMTAAAAWGRVVGGRPAFEDLALRLVEAGDAGALEAFLATKLQVGWLD
jgi:hypothetical protein